jgi:monolysocardiolipin acyltransferase
VNQNNSLIPFRWGVGRLILESKIPPIVVCFYHTGLDQVMPETKRILRIPRINKRIICRFGNVIDSYDLIKSSNHMNPDAQRSFITDAIFKATDQLRVLSSNTY